MAFEYNIYIIYLKLRLDIELYNYFLIIFFIITATLHFSHFQDMHLKKINVATVSRLYFSYPLFCFRISLFICFLLQLPLNIERHWGGTIAYCTLIFRYKMTLFEMIFEILNSFCVGKIAYLKNFIFFITEGLD